jgi:hypothetical protein
MISTQRPSAVALGRKCACRSISTPAIPGPEAQLPVAGATASLPKKAVGAPENASSADRSSNFAAPRNKAPRQAAGLCFFLTAVDNRWEPLAGEIPGKEHFQIRLDTGLR